MRLRYVATLALATLALAAAACGSDSGRKIGEPTLIGTPIPTVSPIPPTEVVCAPSQQITLPANFPAEIPVPPNFTVWSVEQSPHLKVVGRVMAPLEPPNPPHGVVADALVRLLEEKGWRTMFNEHVDGADYDATAPDGRVLHFNTLTKRECANVVELTYDVEWITS